MTENRKCKWIENKNYLIVNVVCFIWKPTIATMSYSHHISMNFWQFAQEVFPLHQQTISKYVPLSVDLWYHGWCLLVLSKIPIAGKSYFWKACWLWHLQVGCRIFRRTRRGCIIVSVIHGDKFYGNTSQCTVLGCGMQVHPQKVILWQKVIFAEDKHQLGHFMYIWWCLTSAIYGSTPSLEPSTKLSRILPATLRNSMFFQLLKIVFFALFSLQMVQKIGLSIACT
jgi:hypothetical protein